MWDTTAPDAEIERVHAKAHEYYDQADRKYNALSSSVRLTMAQQQLDTCGSDQQKCLQAQSDLDGLWKGMHEARIDKLVYDEFHSYAVCILRARGHEDVD